MRPFTVHEGRGVVLRRTNVDTDQIVPSEYCKRVSRTGFADGLFARWREDPDFVLCDPAHRDATVLIAGSDFGTGSSREHAVWALQDWGFRSVVSSRFGDIFRSNAMKNGLLPVTLPEASAERLMRVVEDEPLAPLVVDLRSQEIVADGERTPFNLDPDARWRLLNGYDDIELTLKRESAITAFETQRPHWFPDTAPPAPALIGSGRLTARSSELGDRQGS